MGFDKKTGSMNHINMSGLEVDCFEIANSMRYNLQFLSEFTIVRVRSTKNSIYLLCMYDFWEILPINSPIFLSQKYYYAKSTQETAQGHRCVRKKKRQRFRTLFDGKNTSFRVNSSSKNNDIKNFASKYFLQVSLRKESIRITYTNQGHAKETTSL